MSERFERTDPRKKLSLHTALRTMVRAIIAAGALHAAVPHTPKETPTQEQHIVQEELNETQRYMRNLTIPPHLENDRQLHALLRSLSDLDVSIISLGGDRPHIQKAHEYVNHFLEKMQDARSIVTAYKDRYTTPANTDMLDATLHTIDELSTSARTFITGGAGVFKNIRPLQTIDILDPHDIKTAYLKAGVPSHRLTTVMKSGMTAEEALKYSQSGLLDGCVKCLEEGVPFITIKEFLDHFSDTEHIALQAKVFSTASREALRDIGRITPQGAHTDFLAQIIRNGFPIENIRPKQPELLFFTLFAKKPRPDMMQALSSVRAFVDAGLTPDEVVWVDTYSDSITLEQIQNHARKFGGIITPSDVVFSWMHLIDLNELHTIFTTLGSGGPNAISKDTLRHVISEQGGSAATILEFSKHIPLTEKNIYAVRFLVEAGVTPQEAKNYLDAGVESLDAIVQIRSSSSPEESVPISFVRELAAAHILKDQSVTMLKNLYQLHRNGTSIEEMRTTLEETHAAGIPNEITMVDRIKYWPTIRENPARVQLLHNLIKAGYGELLFHNNTFEKIPLTTSYELMTFIRENDLEITDAGLLQRPEVRTVVERILAHKKRDFVVQVPAIASLLDTGMSPDEITEAVQHGMSTDLMLLAQENTTHWRDYLPYLRFNHTEASENIALMAFFKLDPDMLDRYITRTHTTDINTIIRSEARARRLTPDLQDFYERFNLSFVSRIPLAILTKMKEGYTSPEAAHKPVAVIVTTKTDWNNAFESGDIYTKLLGSHNVYVYEAASDVEALHAVADALKDTPHKKVSLVFIGGHGNAHSISLSDHPLAHAEIDASSALSFTTMRTYLNPDAQIALRSCSTGQGGVGDNIASKISEWLGGIPVHAPEAPTNIEEITMTDHGTLESITYYGKVKSHIIKALPKPPQPSPKKQP